MRLDINSQTYRLSLARGPLVQGGQSTGAMCDHARRVILISTAVPAPLRPKLAALAVNEAWQRQLVQRPPLRFVGDVS